MDRTTRDPASARARLVTPRPIAWVDGRVVPAGDATVPLLDDGFLRGDAVFDSVLVRSGRTHALDAHLARLRRSAQALDLRLPVLRQVIADLLAAWGDRDGALRLIVTRDGTVRGILGPVRWPPSMSLATIELPWRTALTGIKTLSYAANQLAVRRAKDLDADDALIVEDEHLLELPTGSVLLVHDGVVSTPDPGRLPILDSMTVQVVAEVVDVHRTLPTIDDLRRADEVFVVSATRPVLPVHAVTLPPQRDGDAEVPADERVDATFPSPGPVTTSIRSALDEHITATLDPVR